LGELAFFLGEYTFVLFVSLFLIAENQLTIKIYEKTNINLLVCLGECGKRTANSRIIPSAARFARRVCVVCPNAI
jgi:hypothetical protein